MLARLATILVVARTAIHVISVFVSMLVISFYDLNGSYPIKGLPVLPSYYLYVFGCGLVFWLLLMLRSKLHVSGDSQADIRKVEKLAKLHGSGGRQVDVHKLAILITLITTLNLCGGLLAPFPKLPLLVRFLVLFQVSSNLALLLIWTFLSLKEWVLAPDALTQQEQISSAGGSGSGHGSGASGREENRGRYEGNDGGGGAGGGGDRGASGSGRGSGTSGSGENSGGYEGHDLFEGGAGRDGSEGGDRGWVGGGGDPESGGRGTNMERAFRLPKIIEMSLMLTAQTTAALIGYHLNASSFPSKALLVVALIDQLVAYLCNLTSMLFSSDENAARIFADIGFACTALGFILMVAMFVPWYLVLITLTVFGVVWLIFFQNELMARLTATAVWNYLKNSLQSIKDCIRMPSFFLVLSGLLSFGTD